MIFQLLLYTRQLINHLQYKYKIHKHGLKHKIIDMHMNHIQVNLFCTLCYIHAS